MIAVAAPIGRHLPAAHQVEHEPGNQGACRAQQRVGEREHAGVSGGEAAAAVEAEPAEPEETGPEQHVDCVVRQQGLPPVVLSCTDNERGRQRREAGAHLDRHATGEVERPALEQPATAEGPVRDHGVDEHRPQRGKGQEGSESHPLHDGARDQGGRDDAEGRLEREEDQVRDRRSVTGLERHVLQREVAEAADKVTGPVERKRIAHQRPGDGRNRERGDAHHERVERILCPHESRVEESRALPS